MTLSRREGVDIRPTLLRVLTDLYVQTNVHSDDEARQFVELTSRLIDQVDDTRARRCGARLSIYPATPPEVLKRLANEAAKSGQRVPVADEIPSSPVAQAAGKPPTEAQLRMHRTCRCSRRTPPRSTTCSSPPRQRARLDPA